MSASLFFGIATSHVQFCVLVCASFSKIFNQEHDRIVVKIESYGSRWMKAWERSSEIRDTLTLVLLPWPGPLKPSPAGLSHVYFGFIWAHRLKPSGDYAYRSTTGWPWSPGLCVFCQKPPKSKVTKKWCNWEEKKTMSWSKSIRNNTYLLIQFSS